MISCFKCIQHFVNLKTFLKHLKLFHGIKGNGEFKCCSSSCGCNGMFQNVSSFSKHMKKNLKFDQAYVSVNQTVNNCIGLETKIISQRTFSSKKKIFNNLKGRKEAKNDFRNKELDIAKIIDKIEKQALAFTVSLHKNDTFSRKVVLDIQKMVTNLLLEPITESFNEIIPAVKNGSLSNSNFHQLLKIFHNPFRKINTEHKFIEALISADLLVSPKAYTINNQVETVIHCGEAILRESEKKAAIIPLTFLFRKIFEKDNNFSISKNHLDCANHKSSDEISNFVEGTLWKDKVRDFGKQNAIPFFLYFDDLEVNDPLSSHSQSVCAAYFSFPTLKNSSKLCNIYLAGVIKTADLKLFGNANSLSILLDEINSLANDGISLNTSEGIIQVYFLLGLVLGDNLGINGILDFTKSFSSNFFCRFCKEHKSECRKAIEENVNNLRNIENYSNDVTQENTSMTGITQSSIFNTIVGFHAVTNYAVDIMHDIFEGICHYNLSNILTYYIDTLKLFSLETFNIRKQFFNYGSIEASNLSVPIKYEHLKKRHFKMTAKEMMCFVHFFPLIIGDLIPENDQVWEFFCNFLSMIDLLLSRNFNTGNISLLKEQIKEHNSQYVKLFNDTLKPKHHLLTHYPAVIKNSGPPRFYWSFRYEAKHREMKLYVRAITSRKNISLSLIKKYQLKFANNILSSEPESSDVKYENIHIVKSCYENLLNLLSIPLHQIVCVSQCEYDGTTYKSGYCLTRFFNNQIRVYEILEVVVWNCTNLSIICKQKHVIGFSSHFQAYIINETDLCTNYEIFERSCFSGPPLTICKTASKLNLLRLKEYF